MKIEECKVGDELFRFVEGGGIFRYVVIGRRERQSEVQLEVECKTCSHGFQCQLLLGRDDYGRITHIHMLNDDEDNSQRIWHTNDGHFFVSTVEEAKAGAIKKQVQRAKEQVSKAEDALRQAKARLKELQGLDEGVQP